MSVFDRTPPPEPPEEERDAWTPGDPWDGRPDFQLGTVLPTSTFLVRTEDVVVTFASITAFPAGCDIAIRWAARRTTESTVEWRTRQHVLRREEAFELDAGPARGLQFGVVFEGGASAVTSGYRGRQPAMDGPDSPTLRTGGNSHSGGGTERYSGEQSIWLSPLPPADSVRFAVKWLDLGIQETSITLDAAAIRAAAAQSEHYWPGDAAHG